MPATEADLLSIIEKFYEAALEPSRWESALQALSLAMGGFGASLLPTAQPEKCISSGSLFDANVAYAQEWGAHDPRVQATLALGLDRGVHTDHDLALDIERHPFFQEFLRPHELGYIAGFLATPAEASLICLSVHGHLGKGPFESDQLDVLSRVGPHAARAIAIADRLGAPAARQDTELLAFVNRLDCGAVVVARSGEVVAANTGAEALFNDGLAVIRRRLVSSSSSRQSALDRLLHAAFNQQADDIGALTLSRPSGKRPLVLQTVPLSKAFFPGQFIKKPGLVLVLVHDVEKKGRAPKTQALIALGLTLAEVRVAMLIGSGFNPSEASDQLGITVDTVRTHLKNINLKLGFRRQTDLVQLVTRLGMVK